MSIRLSFVVRFRFILMLLPIYSTISPAQALSSSEYVEVPFANRNLKMQGNLHMREPRTKISERAAGLSDDVQMSKDNAPTSSTTPCTDPVACNPVSAITALWRCNIATCTDSDWVGGVISWPSWSAYSSNARTGNDSRTVYSQTGEVLYPYMGSWADGCQVTVISGNVLIIEWQRGTNVWRGTPLYPGDSYTIDLVAPEDNAMIEAPDGHRAFSVSLANCNPQDIYSGATLTPTATVTPSPTDTAIATPTFTQTATVTATFTYTPTASATATNTSTATPTATATQTATPTATFTNTATAIPTATFLDVPVSHWAWSYVERLYSANITSGCGGRYFCPTTTVTRDQMSAFMLKAKYGADYLPPNAVGMFKDVSVSSWAARWVEQAAREGIIPACNVSLKLFCPTSPVTRDYMAVFLLKAKYGTSYKPPPPVGVFTDVSVNDWAAPWIEKLAADGVTYGCTVTPRKYCPGMTVTRDQMSIFLVKNFDLP